MKDKKQVPMRGVKITDDIYNLYKVVDKLEQRISTLEKTAPKKEESNQLEFNFNQDQPLLVELNN